MKDLDNCGEEGCLWCETWEDYAKKVADSQEDDSYKHILNEDDAHQYFLTALECGTIEHVRAVVEDIHRAGYELIVIKHQSEEDRYAGQ